MAHEVDGVSFQSAKAWRQEGHSRHCVAVAIMMAEQAKRVNEVQRARLTSAPSKTPISESYAIDADC